MDFRLTVILISFFIFCILSSLVSFSDTEYMLFSESKTLRCFSQRNNLSNILYLVSYISICIQFFLNLKSGTRDQRLNLPPNARRLPGVCVPKIIMNQTFVKWSNEMGFKFGFSYTVLKSSLLILFTIHISQWLSTYFNSWCSIMFTAWFPLCQSVFLCLLKTK